MKKNILDAMKEDVQKEKEKDVSREKLKDELSGEKEIRIDNPQVTIAKMQIDALLQLSDEKNLIFSELDSSEIFDVSRAFVFAENPLPNISQRINEKGLEVHFKLPILTLFLNENLKHRIKTKRKRTEEILEGLKSMSPRQNNVFANDAERQSLMQRLSR